MEQNASSTSQIRPPATGSGTWERLRIYLIGVGIGVMLLGTFWQRKRQAQQREAAETAASQTPGQPGQP